MWSAVIACGLGAIVLVAVCFRWSRRKVNAAMAKMNGPPTMPLIGHLHLIRFTNQVNIFNFMNHIGSTYPSPVGLRLGHINVVVVHHPEHLQTIMTSPHCISRPFFHDFLRVSRGLFSSPAHMWRGQRKVLSHSFGPGILSSFVPIFNEKSATLTRLMGVHVGKGEHDFHREMAKVALDTIYSTAFGTNFDMQVVPEGDKYLDYQEMFAHLVVKRMFSTWCYIERMYRFTKDFKREQEALAYAKTLTDRVLKARKADDILSRKIEISTPAEDMDGRKPMMFLDKVLELARDNKLQLAKDDIAQHMNTIVFAGNDTTANTMSNVLLMLAMHPDVQERVYQEVMEACPGTDQSVSMEDITKLTYTEMVCKETMRLFPVGPIIARVAEKDIKLSDEHEIPEGCILICGIYVAHRDPKIWGPKASEFNPDHFLPENVSKLHPYAYLPFSGGVRNCIAVKYAWISMKITIVHILRKYRLTTSLTMDKITLGFFGSLKIANGCCISLENR
ncbi:probable cytochrome P450 313a4 [Armigeres subalbatus]|uniref:probable cytochrome P450 313a4 n=1 Tax=Armigeres subalbatus TaxID=124917 RepID=UPI002ED307FB